MPNPPKKKPDMFIHAGTLKRPEDDFCKKCLKPALWEGMSYLVNIHGIRPYGKVKGCRDCKVWFYFNAVGDLVATRGAGAEKEKQNGTD